MSCLHLFFLCFVLGLGTSAAERTELPQHNFLFIVDSSISMAPRKSAAIKLVRDIITAGFNGQIEAGDSIDIWTYDTENNLYGFPPQIWRPNDAQRIAGTAAQYLEQYTFKGRSRFANVAVDLNTLVPQTKNLLTIIITDGEEPFTGISLDLIINEYVAKKKRLGVPSGKPLLISLAAIKGSFRTWTAYFGEDDLHLASLPERRMAPLALAQAEPIETKKPQPKASAPDSRKEEARKRGGPQTARVARVLPLSADDSEEDALERPLELSLSEQLKNFKWPLQSRATAPVSKRGHVAKPAATTPAPNVAAPIQKTKVAEVQKETKATNLALLSVAPISTNKATNRLVATASVAGTPPPGTTRKTDLSASSQIRGIKPNPSSATNLVTATTFHRGFYISGMAGLSCLVAGIYLIRKLRRPTQSIISRSLLQR